MEDVGLLGSVVGNGDFVGMTYALKEIGAFAQSGWNNVLPELQVLINGVVRLSLVMTMMVWLFKPSPDVISEFFWVVIKLNFVLWIMNNFWDIVQKIFDGMVGMGLAAAPDVVKGLTNTDALQDPGRVAKLGTVAVTPLIDHIDSMLGPVDFFLYITELLFAYGALIATVSMFLVCGLLVFLATAEFYIVAIPAGCMAPFIAWGKSAFIATPAIAYVINSGIRLFGTTVVIVMGLSIMLAYKWPEEPTIQDSQNLLILTIAILAAALSVFKKMSGLINGGPVSDVGGALSAMWYAARLGGAAGKEISEVGAGLTSGRGPLPRAASGFINGVRGGGPPGGGPTAPGVAANLNSPGGLRGAFQRGIAGARANVAAGAAGGGGSSSSWYMEPTGPQRGLADKAGISLDGMNRAQATVALEKSGYGPRLNTGSQHGIAAATGYQGSRQGSGSVYPPGPVSSSTTSSSSAKPPLASMKQKVSGAIKEVSGGFKEGLASGYGAKSKVTEASQKAVGASQNSPAPAFVKGGGTGSATPSGTSAAAPKRALDASDYAASEHSATGSGSTRKALDASDPALSSGNGDSGGVPSSSIDENRRALEADPSPEPANPISERQDVSQTEPPQPVQPSRDSEISADRPVAPAPQVPETTSPIMSNGSARTGAWGADDTGGYSSSSRAYETNNGQYSRQSPQARALMSEFASPNTMAQINSSHHWSGRGEPNQGSASNRAPLGSDINGMSRMQAAAAIRERALALPKGAGDGAGRISLAQIQDGQTLGTDVSGMTRSQAAVALSAHKNWYNNGVANAKWGSPSNEHPYSSVGSPTPAHMVPRSSPSPAISTVPAREGLTSSPTAPNPGDRPVMRSAAGAHVHRTFSPKSGGTGHQVTFNEHRNDGRFQIPGERLPYVGQGGGQFGTGYRPSGWQSPSVKASGVSALSGENYWQRRSSAGIKERHFGVTSRPPRAPKSIS